MKELAAGLVNLPLDVIQRLTAIPAVVTVGDSVVIRLRIQRLKVDFNARYKLFARHSFSLTFQRILNQDCIVDCHCFVLLWVQDVNLFTTANHAEVWVCLPFIAANARIVDLRFHARLKRVRSVIGCHYRTSIKGCAGYAPASGYAAIEQAENEAEDGHADNLTFPPIL